MTGTVPLAEPFPMPRMHAMDGAAELAVATATEAARSRAEAVTAILGTLLETIGNEPASTMLARGLPCATREWLLQWSAAHLCPQIRWFEASCSHCGEPFDLSIDLSHPVCRAPSRPAGDVSVETSIGTRRFSIPTGEHEEQAARLPAQADPRRSFARLCGLAETAADDAEQFDEHDLTLIDEALEAASPDIADEIVTACPSCGEQTSSRIDPLGFAFPREGDILREIHLIATAYGWLPPDILALPARHRAWYAGTIARERRAGRRP